MTNELQKLLNIISAHKKLAVAFSGGVDSAFLLKAASLALPSDKILAITACGPFFPQRESREAAELSQSFGLPQLILNFNAPDEAEVAANRPDRCYHCKKNLFNFLISEAGRRGFTIVADGGNLDDLNDYRPGAKAVAELGIISPLKEAGLRKADVRRLSAELGLPTWNKPAFACLASRIPYGHQITAESLERIEKAEDYLLSQGFSQIRVRAHDRLARLEVEPDERRRFFDLDFMNQVNQRLMDLGFVHVALDLAGYRSGSLNTAVGETEKEKYRQHRD